jgi:hypothetical protein
MGRGSSNAKLGEIGETNDDTTSNCGVVVRGDAMVL